MGRKVRVAQQNAVGRSAAIVLEHVWHGEIVPWAPFITAMRTPEETAEMLREIAVSGTLMAVLITAVWAVMVLIAIWFEKKKAIKVAEGV